MVRGFLCLSQLGGAPPTLSLNHIHAQKHKHTYSCTRIQQDWGCQRLMQVIIPIEVLHACFGYLHI